MRKFLLITFMMLGLTVSLYAQERTVTGKVTDSKDSSPLPGVSVGIKGTSSGAITDIDGKYSITVPSDETVLVFTFVGYLPQEITVSVMSVIDIQLVSDVKVLKDVIVTANAVEKEKRSLGYSITELKNEDLVKGSERSFLNAMQGKVAGVFLQSNGGGSVGGSTRVVIRGGTSITGNNQPLFVVDGIPIDNTMNTTPDMLNNQVDAGNRANDISPEDIESLTILKGPAAAALYGARASNGAIIITTKSGKTAAKNKKMEVAYSTSFTLETPLYLPEFQNQYGQGLYGKIDLRENTSWGEKFDGQMRPWGRVVDGEQQVKPYTALPNNVKDFFNVGKTFSNNVSLGGGNEQSNFYFSFGDLNQKGIMPNTQYRRTSIRATGSTKLSNKFYASTSINYIRSNGDLSVQGQGNVSPYYQVLQTPRDISLIDLKDLNNKFNTEDNYYSPYTTQPWYKLYNNFYKNDVNRIIGNAQIGYKATDWLDISYRIGTDVYTDKRRQGRNVSSPTGSDNVAKKDPGFYEERTYTAREVTSDLMINFKKDLSENFSITALLGQNVRQRDATAHSAAINDLVIPGLFNLSNTSGKPTINSGIIGRPVYPIEQRRLYAVYTDINLSFKKFLFLGITARNDWSSTLPKGANSFFYPSTNLSFVFTDAFNIKGKALTYGKIRTNFAQVGNDPTPYILQSYFNSGTIGDGYNNSQINLPIGGVSGFTIDDTQGNPVLKPEITQSFEVGTDLYFANDRIKLEATYYNNVSKNQIVAAAVPYSSGYSFKYLNTGLMTNKGVELLLTLTPVSIPNSFRWDLTVNFTKNVNLVKELGPGLEKVAIGGTGSSPLYAVKGQPYGVIYTETELRDGEGRIVVDPSTGYPLKDPTPKPQGSIQPDFLAGLTNTFSYKGLSLSVTFNTRQGGFIYSNTKHTVEFAGTSTNTLYNDRQLFVIPNSVLPDGTVNTNPIADITTYWTSNDNRPESNAILDASYIKLREVNLSYKLPNSWLKKTPFGSIQIALVGRNLLLWTPKKEENSIFSRHNNIYIDPEVNSFGNGNSQGFEFISIPSVRSYGANIRVTF